MPDVTITLTDDQVALARAIGYEPSDLCQLEVDGALGKWQQIAKTTSDASFLSKKDAYEQAGPKATKEEIQAAVFADAVAVIEP